MPMAAARIPEAAVMPASSCVSVRRPPSPTCGVGRPPGAQFAMAWPVHSGWTHRPFVRGSLSSKECDGGITRKLNWHHAAAARGRLTGCILRRIFLVLLQFAARSRCHKSSRYNHTQADNPVYRAPVSPRTSLSRWLRRMLLRGARTRSQRHI